MGHKADIGAMGVLYSLSPPNTILLLEFCNDASAPEWTFQNATTTLHAAASSGKSETVKLLLDHKADVYAVDKV